MVRKACILFPFINFSISFVDFVLWYIFRRQEEKIAELEERLQQCERNRESCKRQLHQAMAFARELIAEQESLVTQLDERRSVVKLGSDIAARLGNLRLRLKVLHI